MSHNESPDDTRGAVPISFLQTPSQRPRHTDSIMAWSERPDIQFEATLNTGLSKSSSVVSKLKQYIPYGINFKKVSGEGLWYTWGAIPFHASLGKQPRYVIELDNPYALCGYNVRRFRSLKRILLQLLNQSRCQRIICLSKAAQHNLIQELGVSLESKTSVLYPFLKTRYTSPHTRQESYSLCSFASSPRARGVPVLLAAMRVLQEKIPSIRLTLVVPERYHQEYRAVSSPNVTFLPYTLNRTQLFSVLRSHDVLVHPTLQDSFGMVLLEALSCGLPIVATDVYAIREIVLHGVTGFLFQPSVQYYDESIGANEALWSVPFERIAPREADKPSVHSLVKAVLDLYDVNLWERMSAAAHKHFQNEFSEQVWHRRVSAVLSGVQQ